MDLSCIVCEFLSARTRQIRLEDSFSSVASVSSGVVEGSVLGPHLYLYSIVADSLMRRIRLPRLAYANDFKFGDNVAVHIAKL